MSWPSSGLLPIVSRLRLTRPADKAALAGVILALLASPASAQELTHEAFAGVMNSVFGRGAWRMTGGYRTPARENELRAQGARTVRPGGVSRHSLGRPGAPGAYDLVVNGMSPFEAAERLRRAGAPFARYQPKGAHGTQGPHLHLEPFGFGRTPSAEPQVQVASAPADKGSRARALVIFMPPSSPRRLGADRSEFARLRAEASQNRPEAQLRLGRAYVAGYYVPRDFDEAEAWLTAAASNPDADPETRDEAIATLAQLPELAEAEGVPRRDRYAGLSTDASGR